jgi:hypothetical protein
MALTFVYLIVRRLTDALALLALPTMSPPDKVSVVRRDRLGGLIREYPQVA